MERLASNRKEIKTRLKRAVKAYNKDLTDEWLNAQMMKTLLCWIPALERRSFEEDLNGVATTKIKL